MSDTMQGESETLPGTSCRILPVLPSQEERQGGQEEDPPDLETQYGLGSWRPVSLQRLSTLWAFVCLYMPCAIFKVSITQYTRTQVSAIEDHFQINSSKAGFLICAVDIGSAAFALIGAHFGRFMHIPRLLAASSVVAGVATMAISVVQMAKPRSLPSDPSVLRFGSIARREKQKLLNELCWTQATAERFQLPFNISRDFNKLEAYIRLYRDENYNTVSDSLPWTYFWTMGALIVAGAVMSYKLALQTYYIEHNVENSRESGKYIGVLQAAMVFGSPVALFLSAFTHRIPVDIEQTNMSTSDPRWVSAWWLGYVIIGVFLVFLSIPVFPVPRRIATQKGGVAAGSSCELEENGPGECKGTQIRKGRPQPRSRRQRKQRPTRNRHLLQADQFHPGYHSNDHTDILDQKPKYSDQYVSDDESFRTLYDKLGDEHRKFLSCDDLYNSGHFQLHMKDLKDLLLSEIIPKSDRNMTNAHKHQGYYLPEGKETHLTRPIPPSPDSRIDYPRKLKRSNSRVSSSSGDCQHEVIAGDGQDPTNLMRDLNKKLMTWPESLKRLMKNPVIILMVIEGTLYFVGLLGPLAFQLKYIEDQFDEPASKISFYLGIGQLSTAVAGTYLGGYLTTRFSLTRVEMFKAALASQVAALILSSSFVFLGCDNHQIIGLDNDPRPREKEACLCANNSILLLCGSDGNNYLSPCVAGCQDIDDLNFRNCSHIQGKGTGSPGFCDNHCHSFFPLLLIYVLLIFVATLALAPRTLMICRSVALEDESLANGLVNGFVLRCAAIGGPILFGKLYDDACILWPHDNGSCKVVNKEDLRIHFQGTGLLLRAFGTIFMFAATIHVILKDRAEKNGAQETEDRVDDAD